MDSSTGLRNHQAMFEHLVEAFDENRYGVVMQLEIRNMNRIRMIYGGDVASSLIRILAGDFTYAVGKS